MKTLIIYESKHGATAKCAEKLSKALAGETVLCNLKENSKPELGTYDRIVVGGPIYAGRLPKKMRTWLQGNLENLNQKQVGVFACGMTEGEKTEEVIRNAFPAQLISQALAIGFLGGAFYMDKMNFLEKWIIKKVSQAEGELTFSHGPNGDFIEKYNEEALATFSEKLNNGAR